MIKLFFAKYSSLIAGIVYFLLGILVFFHLFISDLSQNAGIAFLVAGFLFLALYFWRRK